MANIDGTGQGGWAVVGNAVYDARDLESLGRPEPAQIVQPGMNRRTTGTWTEQRMIPLRRAVTAAPVTPRILHHRPD